MNVHQSARNRAPRLNAMASCVLAAFGLAAAGSLGAGYADAANARIAQSNRTHSAPVPRPTGEANRNAGRNAWPVRSGPTRPAGAIVVSNCDDSGPGSLRQAMTDAVDGDVIDLTALACSTITLTSGPVGNNVSVTLTGPGRDQLSIDGNASSRVLLHNGADLNVSGVTLANGRYAPGYGGCIWAGGNVTLTDSRVTGCVAGDGTNNGSYGGGVDVIGDLLLINSIVSGNTANALISVFGGGVYAAGAAYVAYGSTVSGNDATAQEGTARGGGVFAQGNAILYINGTVADNRVESTNATAYGGGVHANGGAVISLLSTISGNTAHSEADWSYGGGIQAGDEFGDIPGGITLVSSTLSGNTSSANCESCFIQGGGAHAFGAVSVKYSTVEGNVVVSGDGSNGTARGGGIATYANEEAGEITLLASTVSGNSAIGGSGTDGNGYGGGMASIFGNISASNSTVAFNSASHAGGGATASNYANMGTGESQLVSSIFAGNLAPEGADINPGYGTGSLVVVGDHNLVTVAGANVTLPGDTLSTDPLLQPLASNGGATRTHAIPACSPAIDIGSNPQTFDFDQRGSPYVRVSGVEADIGAFELQPDADSIFRDGFEGSPCS